MKQSITLREFAQWQAYFHIEPFGQTREDLRVAVAAARIASVWAGKNVDPKHCLLRFEADAEQTEEEQDRILLGM